MIVPLRPLIGTSDNGGTWSLISTTATNWFITYSTDVAHTIYVSTFCPSATLPHSLGAMNDDAYLDTENWTPGTYVFRYSVTGTCGTSTTDVTLTVSDTAIVTAVVAIVDDECFYAFPHDFNFTATATVVSKRVCPTSNEPYTGATLNYEWEESYDGGGLWNIIQPPSTSNVYPSIRPGTLENQTITFRALYGGTTCNPYQYTPISNTVCVSGYVNAGGIQNGVLCPDCGEGDPCSYNLKDLLVSGGEGIPLPYSCTHGQGSHYEWIDVDNFLGNGTNYVMCCSTTYADDCIIDLFLLPTELVDCSTYTFKYRAHNDNDLGSCSLDCAHEITAELEIRNAYNIQILEHFDGGVVQDINLLDVINNWYMANFGVPFVLSSCRTWRWEYQNFLDLFSNEPPNTEFGICNDFGDHPDGLLITLPTGTCVDVEDVSMQYNSALGSHTGLYKFNLIGEAVDCPTDFNIQALIWIDP